MITFKEVLVIEWELYLLGALMESHTGEHIPEKFYASLSNKDVTVRRIETTKVVKI